MTMLAAAANATVLRVFFSVLLLAAGFYMLRSLTTRITYYPGHAPPAPSGTVSSARSCTSRYLRSE